MLTISFLDGNVVILESNAVLTELSYVICILHLRLRLIGHILQFIGDTVNAFSKAADRRRLHSNFIAELQRCSVTVRLAKWDPSTETLKMYEPTGDIADKLVNKVCHWL